MASWTEEDCAFMRAALEEADKSRRRREVPVGCVLVRDGAIIARGHNMTNASRNGTRHAEFEAIDYVLQQSQGSVSAAQFPRCKLYVTVEPCIMCSGALSILGIGEVIFGCGNDKFGGCGSILDINVQGCGGCGGPIELPGSPSESLQQPAPEEAQHHQHQRKEAAVSLNGDLQQQTEAQHHQHHHHDGGQHGSNCHQGEQQWGAAQSYSLPQPQQNDCSISQTHQHGSCSHHSHHSQQQQGQGQEHGPCSSSTRSTFLGYKHRRGLFADQAVKFLQDFYVCGNPAAPKPHRPLRKPKWEVEGQA